MITISDNEDEGSSSGEENEDQALNNRMIQASQFAGNISDSDSDSSSGPRVVVSAIQRFHNSLTNLLDTLQSSFDDLKFHASWECIKEIQKHHKKHRQLLHGRFPQFEFKYFLKLMTLFILNLEEKAGKTPEAKEFQKEVKRQPQADQKAFKNLTQKLLKWKNLIWVDQLKEFREVHKDDLEAACELSEEDENEDDSDFDFESESESESSEEEPEEFEGLTKEQRMRMREFWVKTTDVKKKPKKEDSKPKKKKKSIHAQVSKKESTAQSEVWDEKRVRKLLTALTKQKTNLDRSERRKTIEQLKRLEPHCTRPQWRLLSKRLIIRHLARMYTSPSIMKSKDWRDLCIQVQEFIALLTEYPEYRVHELGSLTLELSKAERKKMKEVEDQESRKGAFGQGVLGAVATAGLGDAEKLVGQYQANLEDLEDELVEGLDPKFKWIQGSLDNFVNLLASDLRFALKRIKDPNADDYKERLEDELSLVKTANSLLNYTRDVLQHKMYELSCRSFLLVCTFEHYDKDYDLLGKPKDEQKYLPYHLGDETEVLKNIKEIFKMVKLFNAEAYGSKTAEEKKLFEDIVIKIRYEAILRTVHYLARHHRYLLARDILTSSGVSRDAMIVRCEVNTQILYNRTVARLAIAAFTHGDWKRSMDICKDLYTTGKHKELLAQGIKSDLRWKNNKTPAEQKQEQEEKSRMVPEHSFINPDLLESVHFIASLFFEIKAILTGHGEYNKSFRKQWSYRAKREFLARPENNRDKIMEAGDNMKRGNWKECQDLLESLKCWTCFTYVDQVKAKVFKRAKEECLRCYLISSSKHFSDIKIDTLAEKFIMDRISVIQLCSRFISDGDFKASIDLQGGYLIIHESLPTQFVTNAFEYQEKLESFMGSIRDIADSMGIQRDFRGKRKNYHGNNNRGDRGNQKSGLKSHGGHHNKKPKSGNNKRWSRF